MRKFILTVIIILSAVQLHNAQLDTSIPRIRIGVLTDGPWIRNSEVMNILKEEVNKLVKGEFNVIFPEEKYKECGWDFNLMQTSFNEMMNDDKVDMVITFGEILSRIAALSTDFPKPVIAPLAINAELQNMPISDGASGIKNLNYITFTSTLGKHIEQFRELKSFSKAVLLINDLYRYGHFAEDRSKIPEKFNLSNVDLTIIPVGDEPDKIINKVPQNTEAVIAYPLLHLQYDEIAKLYSSFGSRGIPVFTVFDEQAILSGAVGGDVPKDFFRRLSRRIALNLQSIFLGEEPGNIPVEFPIEREFVINMKKAMEFNLYPSWSLLTDARLINEEKKIVERKLTLFDAINEAVKVNLDIRAKRKEVEAGEENIGIARANLLPQLSVSADGILIDKTRAERSNGQQAEKTITGSLVLSQVLFDEKAWSNLDINKLQQEILEYENEQVKLDIILEAATSYLNLLSAKSNESIQRENFKKSLANLEIARFRNNVGYAGPSEVYRWESEIANNRKTVIEASANRNISEIDLNRLLNRPLEESFETEEDLLENLVDIISGSRIMKYYDNKWYFKIFRNFIVNEALNYSPELKMVDAGIKTQKRLSTSASNSFFMPSIALQAQLNNTFYRGGAGSTVEPITIPQLGTFSLVQEPKDLNWNIGINFSFPLFLGGSRFAESAKAKLSVSQLEIEKKSLEEKIEKNVRAALHLSGASFAGMREGRNAEEAAKKNLELAVDSYSRGAISITDLVDAQNAALVSTQLASNTRYTFLIDMMNVQRAMGRMINVLSIDERNDFYERLNKYFDENINR